MKTIAEAVRGIAEEVAVIAGAVGAEEERERERVPPKTVSIPHLRNAVEQLDLEFVVMRREDVQGLCYALGRFGWFSQDESIPGADLVDWLNEDGAARIFLKACAEAGFDLPADWQRNGA